MGQVPSVVSLAGGAIRRLRGPDLPDAGPERQRRAMYSAATYIVCGILYTGVNTPVTAILSVLTPDPAQRVLLTTYRMIGGKVGVLLVSALALPLVALLGHGNDKRGFMLTMPLFAAGRRCCSWWPSGTSERWSRRPRNRRPSSGRLELSGATGRGSSSRRAVSCSGSRTPRACRRWCITSPTISAARIWFR